jgi:hypothetical protein
MVDACQHSRVREIGEDFDKDGRLLRLMRCQRCGLILREYLPTLSHSPTNLQVVPACSTHAARAAVAGYSIRV